MSSHLLGTYPKRGTEPSGLKKILRIIKAWDKNILGLSCKSPQTTNKNEKRKS